MMIAILILILLTVLAGIWLIFNTLRQCLDVLRLLAAQGSERRAWKREGER